MGSLSRNFDSWRNHVHLQARNSGPGGQIASLMHEELESISNNTRQSISMQQRNTDAMRSGFNQMNDAVGHLAWVQQQAHQEQLDAQYRVMQLQADTIHALSRTNETLVRMSSQLAEVADILLALQGTQEEHLGIVKAERTLKEVLFQLTTMLEDMIVPEDEVARLCLCQLALDALNHHGLNTSHLSDLADKRVFADFVKKTRQAVRDTPPEVQADLLAFEVWYKGYMDCRLATPLWAPAKSPDWLDGTRPILEKVARPPEPQQVALPRFPQMPPREQLPKKDVNGNDYRISMHDNARNLVVLNPDNGTPITTSDNVPSKRETEKRFPVAMSLKRMTGTAVGSTLSLFWTAAFPPAGIAVGIATYKANAVIVEAMKKARDFEDGLRAWGEGVAIHNDYLKAMETWTAKCVEVDRRNAELQHQYPQLCADFERKERQRRDAYENACRTHLESERLRKAAWNQEAAEFLAALQEQGQRLNEYLDDHPDIKLLYSPVEWERDLRAAKESVQASEAATASK